LGGPDKFGAIGIEFRRVEMTMGVDERTGAHWTSSIQAC
jgi:hypothetical protein